MMVVDVDLQVAQMINNCIEIEDDCNGQECPEDRHQQSHLHLQFSLDEEQFQFFSIHVGSCKQTECVSFVVRMERWFTCTNGE